MYNLVAEFQLGLFGALGISLKTTNCLESLMAQLGAYTDKVDRWRISEQKQRWVGRSLAYNPFPMKAEAQDYLLNRLAGLKQELHLIQEKRQHVAIDSSLDAERRVRCRRRQGLSLGSRPPMGHLFRVAFGATEGPFRDEGENA